MTERARWQADEVPKLDYAVVLAPDQILEITVTGPGVLLFEPNQTAAPADPDILIPDPLAFLAQCATHGLFAAADEASGVAARIEVLDARLDGFTQYWRVKLVNIQPPVLRVLACLLSARELDLLSIRTLSSGIKLPPEAKPPQSFPAAVRVPGFPIQHEVPNIVQKDRLICVEFQRAPTNEELESVYALFAMWIDLLLLGAYPPDRTPPRRSGVIPELAALIDRTVVAQSFTEAFVCHEDAFNAIIGGLSRQHTLGLPIVQVLIR